MIVDAVRWSTTAPGPKVVMSWLGRSSPAINDRGLLAGGTNASQIDEALFLYLP